jgi:UDP-2,3-diacylglucosamine pyrophosphatase LpxH
VALNVDRIKKALTEACELGREQVLRRTLDIATARIAVLSDLHRGSRTGDDDDFWRCEQAYNAALGYYLMSGYTLVLLGDVEELWENAPKDLVNSYPQSVSLEKQFYDDGRLLRVFGNHDDLWSYPDPARDYFGADFPNLVIYEALRFAVNEDGQPVGELVMVHGHQGSSAADRFRIGRAFVRFGYRRLQRKWHVSANTPATDYALRGAHSGAMRDWAMAQKGGHGVPIILIAGHTHQPVFGTSQPAPPKHREVAVVQREYDDAVTTGSPEKMAPLRAELEMVKTARFGTEPLPMPVPCYFNTGCCCFFDGDVTGLEIADSQIRLVRWLDDERKPSRKILVPDDLRAIFESVAAGEPRLTPTMTEPPPE